MQEEYTPNSYDAKIVLLGNSGVGKTSIGLRFVQGSYEKEQQSTIGASFMTKRMVLDNWKVKLQIWDTAGQERFRSMTPMYYRGAQAAILVYDITNEESFENVKTWVKELRTNVHNDIVIAITGNKCDLTDKRVVTFEHGQTYATQINALCCETSAKDDRGIEDMFVEVTRKLILLQEEKQKIGIESEDQKRNQNIELRRGNSSSEKKCLCK